MNRRSLLYPATSFREEMAARELLELEHDAGAKAIHVMRKDGDRERHFVAHAGRSVFAEDDKAPSMALTTSVCVSSQPLEASNALWADEYEADVGAEDGFVMVTGPSQFDRTYPNASDALQRRREGPRDCFAVWGNERFEPFAYMDVAVWGGDSIGYARANVQAVSARTVKGVVFYREIVFDARGHNPSYLERYLMITARRLPRPVLHKDGSVNIFMYNVTFSGSSHLSGFSGERQIRNNDPWRPLKIAAMTGFQRHCHVNRIEHTPKSSRALGVDLDTPSAVSPWTRG